MEGVRGNQGNMGPRHGQGLDYVGLCELQGPPCLNFILASCIIIKNNHWMVLGNRTM